MATEAADRLHTTAESHHRVMLLLRDLEAWQNSIGYSLRDTLQKEVRVTVLGHVQRGGSSQAA